MNNVKLIMRGMSIRLTHRCTFRTRLFISLHTCKQSEKRRKRQFMALQTFVFPRQQNQATMTYWLMVIMHSVSSAQSMTTILHSLTVSYQYCDTNPKPRHIHVVSRTMRMPRDQWDPHWRGRGHVGGLPNAPMASCCDGQQMPLMCYNYEWTSKNAWKFRTCLVLYMYG